MSAPSFAAGSDMKALMDLLLKKGVITQQEYDQNIQAAVENEEFKEKRLSSDVNKLNKLAEKTSKGGLVKSNGLGLESTDGQHSINLVGRVHFDARSFDSNFANGVAAEKDAAKFGDNFEIRRARLGVNGFVFKDITYEGVFNMVGSDTNVVDTAWINYGFNKSAQVRVGRFKQQFNLEELTSSNNIDFMERSYVNALTPGKKVGVMIHGVPMDGTTYGVSAYQNGISQISGAGSFEYSGRLTANIAKLANINDSVIHLGAAGTTGTFDVAAAATGTVVSLRSEHRGIDSVYTASYAGGSAANATAVNKTLAGIEFAYGYGPAKLQAEMAEAKFSTSIPTTDVVGKVKVNYVAVLYNLTGEKWSDAYKDGAFGSIKPLSNFGQGSSGTGAFQLGLRLSEYDASDVTGTITGSSKGKTTTLGLTWFLNTNARMMLNYAQTKFDTPFIAKDVTGGVASDKENAIMLRSQFNF
jgi:phosphate-selective porin OprO/OprP